MVSEAHMAEAVRHPVRFRVLRLLLATDTVSTPTLAEALPGVSRTNLRYHINKLLELGVLVFAGQSRAYGRGKRAHTYRLAADRDQVRTYLWMTKAELLTSAGLDGTAILDPIALGRLEPLKASFLFRLAELERETHQRQATDDAPTTSVAFLMVTGIDL
jgi:predicted ArsR family transcriptional regulator